MFLANEILDMAVQFEKNGEAVYRRAMTEVSDPGLAALLEWMAGEESRHATHFFRLKQEKTGGDNQPFAEKLNREMLDDMIGDQSFSLDDVDFSEIENQDDLIRTFMEFEKDTILFYEMLTPFIEDAETRTTLETIIDEENNHIERLKSFLGNEAALPAFSDC